MVSQHVAKRQQYHWFGAETRNKPYEGKRGENPGSDVRDNNAARSQGSAFLLVVYINDYNTNLSLQHDQVTLH